MKILIIRLGKISNVVVSNFSDRDKYFTFIIVALDKAQFLAEKPWFFFFYMYFSSKLFVMGTYYKHLYLKPYYNDLCY